MDAIHHFQNETIQWLTVCHEKVLIPMYLIQDHVYQIHTRIQTLFNKVIEHSQNIYNYIAEGLYKARFSILYIATASLVAFNDCPLFLSASCVGTVFALVQGQVFPKQALILNEEKNLCKNNMLIQSAFSFVNVTAKVMSLAHWMSYSTEGAISASLSGFMFGHLITTQLRAQCTKRTT